MNDITTYENEIYYRYLSIEDKAYQEKVRFVEEYGEVINNLDTEVMVEIMYNYATALLELEKNPQVIKLTESLLEKVIYYNVYTIANKNILEELLVLKGLSHFKINELDKAEHTFSELIKIHPNVESHQELLFRVQQMRNKSEEQGIRALSIALFLLSAFIIGVELFIIRPFYDHHTSWVELTRNTCFLLGVGLLLGYTCLKKYRNKRALQHIK